MNIFLCFFVNDSSFEYVCSHNIKKDYEIHSFIDNVWSGFYMFM